MNKKEQEIEELKEEQIYELDAVITEGTNAKIPLEFTYPNTMKTVGVQIRPISTNELQTAMAKARKFKENYLIEIFKLATYKMNGETFPPALIEELPVGVVTYVVREITRISGIALMNNQGELNEKLVDELMGF